METNDECRCMQVGVGECRLRTSSNILCIIAFLRKSRRMQKTIEIIICNCAERLHISKLNRTFVPDIGIKTRIELQQ